MKQNVGSLDRTARAFGALAMIGAAIVAPIHVAARIGLGATGVYLVFTALAGTCIGYRLMGRSTCPATSR